MLVIVLLVLLLQLLQLLSVLGYYYTSNIVLEESMMQVSFSLTIVSFDCSIDVDIFPFN